MEHWLAYHWLTTELGFSEAEVRNILQSFNGHLHHADHAAGSYTSYVAGSVQDAILAPLQRMLEDYEAGDLQLTGNRGENHAELQRGIKDAEKLIEKLSNLTEDQAHTLFGFCLGFWCGLDEGQSSVRMAA